MTELERFIDEWIDGQCRRFRAELDEDRPCRCPCHGVVEPGLVRCPECER